MKYFAYGSNMDLEQMKRRCPDNFKLLGIAELEGWEFFINNRGKANIAIDTVDPNSTVYGLLYDVSENCLDSLDKEEGYLRVPKIYDCDLEKVKYKGEITGAWVYVDKKNLQTGKPKPPEYLDRIIDVATNFKFPSEYIKHLKSFK